MFTQIRGPNQHFHAFYEDDSLLIQFIVEEFVQSYRLMLNIKALIQEPLDLKQTLSSHTSALIHIFTQLVGCSRQPERSSFSNWTKGHLTRLKDYCDHFSSNSIHQHKSHVNLHMATHQAWLVAIRAYDLLTSLQTTISAKNSNPLLFLIPLKRTFHTLQMRFNQLTRYLPRVISAYWDNENVILCLLRKRHLLSEIYGNNFLRKPFKWPLQMEQMVELLIERYQARGFETLIPTIQHLLEVEEIVST